MKCLFASTSFSPMALCIGKWVDGATLHASNSLDSIFSPKLRELSKHQSFQKFRKFFSQVTRVRFQGLNRSSNVQLASRGETEQWQKTWRRKDKRETTVITMRGYRENEAQIARDSIFLIQISCGNFFFRLLAKQTRNYLPNVNRYERRSIIVVSRI